MVTTGPQLEPRNAEVGVNSFSASVPYVQGEAWNPADRHAGVIAVPGITVRAQNFGGAFQHKKIVLARKLPPTGTSMALALWSK